MKDTPSDRIALLIDADNAPAAKIDFIMSELAGYGVVNIRRAYGNWKKPGLGGWVKVLHDHAIQPVQFFDLVKGKNATDMGLLIEAMDILDTKEVDTFCLISSDCDFTPLVQRLRADGKRVIGFGDRKTPEPFMNSCTNFLFLDEEKGREKVTVAKKTPGPESPLKKNKMLIKTLCSAVDATKDDDGWSALGPVGSHITNQGPFDHRTYGFRKLSDLFTAIDLFEVKKEELDNRMVVRVRLRE